MRLRLENLSHTYKAAESRTVLNIGDWELATGAQALLRGVSGSGKTTLFNIIAGLLHPTTGEVYHGEQPIYRMSEAARDRFRARSIGYVFQNYNLLPALTALENVMMPMAFAHHAPQHAWRARAKDLIAQVGLSEFAHYLPGRLSTGQRLRVAIARALINEPRLLLADEPSAALDSAASASVMDLIQQSCRANNATLLVASHDPALVARFTTVIDLRAGQLYEDHPV